MLMDKVSIWLGVIFAFLMPMQSIASNSEKLPDGTTFVGLMDDGWRVFLVTNGTPGIVDSLVNVQEVVHIPKDDKLIFIGPDEKLGILNLVSGERSAVPYPDAIERVTQMSLPATYRGEDVIFMVSLMSGRSSRTTIVAFNPVTRSFTEVIAARLATFEPQMSGEKMAYLAVSCVELCQSPVQDVWVGTPGFKNFRQMTSEGSTLRHLRWSGDGKTIFFSKLTHVDSEIWKLDINGGSLSKLTDGFSDSYPYSPSVDMLYFTRMIGSKSVIHVLNGEKAQPIDVGVSNIRDLKIYAR